MSYLSDLNSTQLLQQEQELILDHFSLYDSIKLGEMLKIKALVLNLPVAIEIRLGNQSTYHVLLPGSSQENQSWIDRKARVVLLKQHSTMFERVSAQ